MQKKNQAAMLNWLWSEGNGQKLSAQIEYLDQLVKDIRQVCDLADDSKEKKKEGTTTEVRRSSKRHCPYFMRLFSSVLCSRWCDVLSGIIVVTIYCT